MGKFCAIECLTYSSQSKCLLVNTILLIADFYIFFLRFSDSYLRSYSAVGPYGFFFPKNISIFVSVFNSFYLLL